MKTLISALAAVLLWNMADAQVGSTVEQGAKATGEKAKQYGDQTKASVPSQPNRSADKAKAQAPKG